MYWYCINIHPRKEDYVEINLSRLGVESFNPKLKERKFIRRVLKEAITPLFPCYIFARFDIETHLRGVKYTKGVRKIVSAGSSPIPVEDNIIGAIRDRLDGDGYLSINRTFNSGDHLRIKDGPFSGFKGVFERDIGRDRVIILLNMLYNQVHLTLFKEQLEKID
ncbi:MAG: transcription termination/antitermination protein NusG [Nitrospirota bacterium]